MTAATGDTDRPVAVDSFTQIDSLRSVERFLCGHHSTKKQTAIRCGHHSTKKQTAIRSFKIDPKRVAALERIREQEELSISWQIRKGIDLWLEAKGQSVTSRSKKGASK
jgi:hypothetical protein